MQPMSRSPNCYLRESGTVDVTFEVKGLGGRALSALLVHLSIGGPAATLANVPHIDELLT